MEKTKEAITSMLVNAAKKAKNISKDVAALQIENYINKYGLDIEDVKFRTLLINHRFKSFIND